LPKHDSPLFNEIQTALDSKESKQIKIRISLTEPEWFQPTDGSAKAWVRWLCWSLTDENLTDLSKPIFHVVHGDLGMQTLQDDASARFVEYPVIVDLA
jgi:hypothetical protein